LRGLCLEGLRAIGRQIGGAIDAVFSPMADGLFINQQRREV